MPPFFYSREVIMNVLQKIVRLESTPIIPQTTEVTLNKLINITRTSQWELLQLSDEQCDNLHTELTQLDKSMKDNYKVSSRVSDCRHESISIILDDEDFI